MLIGSQLINNNHKNPNFSHVWYGGRASAIAALEQLSPQTTRYNRLTLINPDGQPLGPAIAAACRLHCKQHNLKFRTADSSLLDIGAGDLLVVAGINDLQSIISRCTAEHLTIGDNAGIIFWGNHQLLKYTAGGITSISVDYNKLSEYVAMFLLGNEHPHKELDLHAINRCSV